MAQSKSTAEDRLPGDLTREELLDRFIRVDHAGEFGAQRIYAGQIAVLGKTAVGRTLRHMKEQEDQHLQAFEELMAERKTRPTALQPIWNVAGYVLGAGTALMGEKAAMACTIAVEEAIDEHYAKQAEQLGDDEADLRDKIEQFRAEELEHRDIGVAHGGEEATGYPLLYRLIHNGSKAAIWLSERV